MTEPSSIESEHATLEVLSASHLFFLAHTCPTGSGGDGPRGAYRARAALQKKT